MSSFRGLRDENMLMSWVLLFLLPVQGSFFDSGSNLLKDGGGALTRANYREALVHYPASLASHFLESPAGFELTAYLAKWYMRLVHGDATSRDLHHLASCWRGVLDSVREHLEAEPVKMYSPARRCSSPFLALNLELGCLEIRFDPRGIPQRAYTIGGRAVLRTA